MRGCHYFPKTVHKNIILPIISINKDLNFNYIIVVVMGKVSFSLEEVK